MKRKLSSSEQETVRIIKGDQGIYKGASIKKEEFIKSAVKRGKIKKDLGKDLFKKMAFNRYILKGDIKQFWKIEDIDGEEYFIIVKD